MFEYTLLIIKSSAVSKNKITEIMSIVYEYGFSLIKEKYVKGTREQWEQHYDEHKNKEFFSDLVRDMCDKDIYVCILKKENAISDLRKLIGCTDPKLAEEFTLRRKFGESKRHNAVHGSDSEESCRRETKIWMGYSISDL